MKIRSYFHVVGTNKLSDHVGLELEYEGLGNHPKLNDLIDECNSEGWVLTADHSLRYGGIELISNPTHKRYAQSKINALVSVLDSLGMTPEISHRCSTHVHVNIADKEMKEFELAYFLLLCLEDTLFESLPYEDRRSNLFALRSSYYADTLNNLTFANALGKSCVFLEHEDYRSIKYRGVSLFRTSNIGTVEFRILPAFTKEQLRRGTLTKWVELFLDIGRGAKSNQKTTGYVNVLEDFIAVCNGVKSKSNFFLKYYKEDAAARLSAYFADKEFLEPEVASSLFFLAERMDERNV